MDFRDATEIVAGPGKQIVNSLLILRITKPDVPDLTLIDLPGITRVPKHDQSSNIFDTIKELYDEHCAGKTLSQLTFTP